MKQVKKIAMKSVAMKSVAKAPLTKGTDADDQVMKKPSSKGKLMYESLTEATLAKLEGASNDKIEQFLVKLSDKEQMCLWKKFESQRKQDGTDGQYRTAVSGCGMKKKSLTCLKAYLKTGGNTKDALFQDLVTKVYATKAHEEKEVRQPLNYMLQRYGMKELKARVLAGTIDCRKNPYDPRFPEFRELLESSSRKITHENSSQVKTTKKASSKDFYALANMDLQELQTLQFADEDDDPETSDAVVKSCFGKGPGSACKDLPVKDEPEKDGDGDQFFKDLETASAVEDATPMSVATLKFLQVKTICQTLYEDLTQIENDVPKYKTTAKKYKADIKDQMQKLDAGEKHIKAKTLKAGVLKKMLIMAASMAKKTKQWILKIS